MFKKFFLALFLVLCGSATAGKMSYTLQEALYRFEMKGESQKAIKLLEKVIEQGDVDDQAEASFHLGKIYELIGNANAAGEYYRQSISKNTEPSKIYWLAEREAAMTGGSEALLKNKIRLPSPIKKIYHGERPYILLHNDSIYTIESDKLVKHNTDLPENSDIISIEKSGIWFQKESRDSLFFKFIDNNSLSRAYPIKNSRAVLSGEESALVLGTKTLTLISRKTILSQVNDKYRNCSIEGFYNPTGDFILNCPDNALHFISEIDGSETINLSQIDAIQNVLIDETNVFVLAGNSLFCYNPKKDLNPHWKVQFSNAEKIIPFGRFVVILEASGKITMLEKKRGLVISSYRSDASNIQPLALGTLGLFTNEGALTAVDTLLRPIWHFNFSNQVANDVIQTEERIYLPFENKVLQGISAHYYGKRPLLSNTVAKNIAAKAENDNWKDIPPLLDSVFKLEPGNAEAWLFKALYLEHNNGNEREKQKAWSEAVRLSVSNPQATQLILNRYGKAIGAKFVNLLKISPKIKYPQLFGNKKNLFTIDPAAERLICLSPETGELRWTKVLSKMDNSPVMGNDENTLAVVSGFSLLIYDLNKETTPTTTPLPGKAFSVQLTPDAIYVSTWNGFLMKVMRSDNRQAWSRKIFSSPLLFARDGEILHLASLEGEIMHLWDGSGQIRNNGPKLQSNISFMAKADSILAIATSANRIYLYNTQEPSKEPAQILMETSIISLQSITFQGTQRLLVGLSNQEILLYTSSGAPIWKYKGKSSLFNSPYIYEETAWIDQGNEVIGLSLKDGHIQKRFSTPGGAGSPFILNKTLYSASSKRLLYGFNL